MGELGEAVRAGRIDDVRRLLDAGAEPNQTNFYGDTLIDMARDRGHTAIVALLEDACARARRVQPSEAPTFTRFMARPSGLGARWLRRCVHRCGYTGQPHADDAAARRRDSTAARCRRVPVVRNVLARGAPANLPDDDLWATPLAWADRRGHREIAATLRRHGAR